MNTRRTKYQKKSCVWGSLGSNGNARAVGDVRTAKENV